MDNLESKLSRRRLLKLGLASAASYFLSPFIGCGSSKTTKESLENIAVEKLIKQGEYFHQFGNFDEIESLNHVSGNKYELDVHFKKCFTNPKGFDEEYVLEIKGIEIFLSHQDEDFAQYIAHYYPRFGGNSLKDKIINGEIRAVAAVKIKAEHSIYTSTETVTGLLEKNQDDAYEWRFVAKRRATEHAILKAFKNAYSKEKDKEFQKFK